MGVEGLTDLLKAVYAALPADKAAEIVRDVVINDLKGSTIIIDFSMLAFQYGAGIKGELTAMNGGCVANFLAFLRHLRSLGNKILIVFDQAVEGANAYDEGSHLLEELQKAGIPEAKGVNFATVLQAKTETRQKRIEDRDQRKSSTHKEQFHVTGGLVNIIELGCDLLGIPALRPLVEADWLLASLAKVESEHAPTYIVTEDTDLLVYDIGKAKVLRRFSLTGGLKHKGQEYQMVDQRRLWQEMHLTDQRQKAYLASMLGCDYYDGVNRLGPKSVMHVLQIEPLYGRGGRMSREYWPILLRRICGFTPSGGIINWSNAGRIQPAKQLEIIRKEFTTHCISPTCFDGMTIPDISKLAFPFNVDLGRVDEFLRYHYTHPVNEEEWERFKQSVQVILVGPEIELHKLLSGKYEYKPSLSSLQEANTSVASSSAAAASSSSSSAAAAASSSSAQPPSDMSSQPSHDGKENDVSNEKVVVGGGSGKDPVASSPPFVTSAISSAVEANNDAARRKCERLSKLLDENLKEHAARAIAAFNAIGVPLVPIGSDQIVKEMERLMGLDDA